MYSKYHSVTEMRSIWAYLNLTLLCIIIDIIFMLCGVAAIMLLSSLSGAYVRMHFCMSFNSLLPLFPFVFFIFLYFYISIFLI